MLLLSDMCQDPPKDPGSTIRRVKDLGHCWILDPMHLFFLGLYTIQIMDPVLVRLPRDSVGFGSNSEKKYLWILCILILETYARIMPLHPADLESHAFISHGILRILNLVQEAHDGSWTYHPRRRCF